MCTPPSGGYNSGGCRLDREAPGKRGILSETLSGVVVPSWPTAPAMSTSTRSASSATTGMAFAVELGRRGIGCGIYCPVPVRRSPSFGSDEYLPVTEEVARPRLPLTSGLPEPHGRGSRTNRRGHERGGRSWRMIPGCSPGLGHMGRNHARVLQSVSGIDLRRDR